MAIVYNNTTVVGAAFGSTLLSGIAFGSTIIWLKA